MRGSGVFPRNIPRGLSQHVGEAEAGEFCTGGCGLWTHNGLALGHF